MMDLDEQAEHRADAERLDAFFCGATRRQEPGRCRMRAGWGTSHPGTGSCKLHGGNTPGQVIKARKEKLAVAVVTYGLPKDVEPGQALLDEVHRTVGHVEWLGQIVASLEQSELKQIDGKGQFERPSVWVEMYQSERKHLTALAKSAVDAGIAERTVRLAEDQGRLLAAGIGWLLAKLERDDAAARTLVATMLRSLAGGQIPQG